MKDNSVKENWKEVANSTKKLVEEGKKNLMLKKKNDKKKPKI